MELPNSLIQRPWPEATCPPTASPHVANLLVIEMPTPAQETMVHLAVAMVVLEVEVEKQVLEIVVVLLERSRY